MFHRHPNLLWTGLAGTVLWIIGVIAYAAIAGIRVPSTFSEIGDFAAGIATPPALLWLVLGYLLQAEELHLQYEELKQQVASTRELAQSARDQIEIRTSEAAPKLEFVPCAIEERGHERTTQWITFRNAGGQARGFSISNDIPPAQQDQIRVHELGVDVVDFTAAFERRLAIDFVPTLRTQRIELAFSFDDVLGTSYQQIYMVELGSPAKPRLLHDYRETAAEFAARLRAEHEWRRSGT